MNPNNKRQFNRYVTFRIEDQLREGLKIVSARVNVSEQIRPSLHKLVDETLTTEEKAKIGWK